MQSTGIQFASQTKIDLAPNTPTLIGNPINLEELGIPSSKITSGLWQLDCSLLLGSVGLSAGTGLTNCRLDLWCINTMTEFFGNTKQVVLGKPGPFNKSSPLMTSVGSIYGNPCTKRMVLPMLTNLTTKTVALNCNGYGSIIYFDFDLDTNAITPAYPPYVVQPDLKVIYPYDLEPDFWQPAGVQGQIPNGVWGGECKFVGGSEWKTTANTVDLSIKLSTNKQAADCSIAYAGKAPKYFVATAAGLNLPRGYWLGGVGISLRFRHINLPPQWTGLSQDDAVTQMGVTLGPQQK